MLKSKGERKIMSLIEVKGLNKFYAGFELSDISFEIPAGYILGYVGQNGAGKTTTLNSIMNLTTPDSGEIRIDGITFDEDPIKYREMIGYIGDENYFPKTYNIKNVRTVLADFYPTFDKNIFDDYISRWNLPINKKIEDFSRGMKVKLMFAAVLARETKVLILDEATNGLDPMMRADILKLLQDFIADGERSIIFSTHIMEDLQNIADYIFFIDNGRKVFFEAKDELLENYLIVKGGPDDLTSDLKKHIIGVETNSFGFSGLVKTDGGYLLPSELEVEKPTIDQIIIHEIEERR